MEHGQKLSVTIAAGSRPATGPRSRCYTRRIDLKIPIQIEKKLLETAATSRQAGACTKHITPAVKRFDGTGFLTRLQRSKGKRLRDARANALRTYE